jgi:PAS domain S-box-containing protein
MIRSFLLVLAIPALTLPVLTFQYLYQNSLQAKRDDSLGKAVAHSLYIETLLEKRAIELLLIGQFPETRRVINANDGVDDNEALQALTRRLESYFRKQSGMIEGFRLLDVRGRERLYLQSAQPSSPRIHSGIDSSAQDYFVGAIHLAALQGRNIPVHISHPQPSSALHYSSLVKDDNGIIAGVLVLEVGLPGILRELNDGGPGHLCNLFDGQGNPLLPPGHFSPCIPLETQDLQGILREESGSLPLRGHLPSSLQVFSRIQPPGQSAIRWTVLYDVPLITIDAPFRTAVTLVATVTLAALVLSIALAMAFSRQITEPLSQLATAADDLCKGYWDTLLPQVRTDDEIRALTQSFASMSRQLRGAHENLLAKVQALGLSEQQLAEEKERLTVTLRSIGDAVIAVDNNNLIRLANPVAEQLLGFPSDLLMGRPISDQFQLRDALSGDPIPDPCSAPEQELRLTNRSGEEFWIETKASPIHTPRGERSGTVIVLRDVTRTRQRTSEQQRIEKLESLGLLAGGIAHDFNNLISVIMGELSLLSTRHPGGDPDHDNLDNASRAAQRARGLTRQLITFAKGGSPVKRSASLRELLEESSRFAMHGSNCCFRLEAPANLWASEVDTAQMHQVFHNLALNAVQAMPQGGVLAIQLENVQVEDNNDPPLPPGPYIRIRLRDQGVGIPPHLLNRVFDPYFTTKEQGHGLGLSSVHSIVKAHQGHIAVYSSPAGTEFTLHLPATSVPAPLPLPTPQSAPIASSTPPLRVLLLDDEADIRSTASRIFRHLGHEVSTAADGREVIAAFRNATHSDKPFDLLLLDLTIPGGMGGRETLEEILRFAPETRAIVTSGYSQDDVMAHYRDHGFHAALQKPFSLEELREAIAAALR